MRTLILILLSYTAFAQADPAQVFGKYTRLGMNGNIKTVTTYKYTKLKHVKGEELKTTGTLYSVIKNWYDTSGRIIQDSTAIFYNPQSAVGYCKTYTYTQQNNKPVIQITTRFDCMPPYDNKAVVETVIELTTPADSTVLVREYTGSDLNSRRKRIVSSYRFYLKNNLLDKTVFDNYKKGQNVNSGTATYKYDEYNNFTHTTLTVGSSKQVIKHDVSHIDDYGNAIRMLNYVNEATEPDFMTTYEFEYYE